MAPTNPIPICETYRNIGIHNFQDDRRIATVKADIDDVYAIATRTAALCRFADGVRRAPEARAFAAALALADIQRAADRRRARRLTVDPELLRMHIAALTSETWRDEDFYCGGTEGVFPDPACMPVRRPEPLPSLAARLAARDRVDGHA